MAHVSARRDSHGKSHSPPFTLDFIAYLHTSGSHYRCQKTLSCHAAFPDRVRWQRRDTGRYSYPYGISHKEIV